MKVSVFLIVKDEEANIERALRSAQWADEIVVVDSGSRDRTCEIARGYTDKIFTRGFTDYGDQKNFAMSKATGDWLLSLDADEELSPELSEEARKTVARGDACAAYRLRRHSNIFGRWFRFTGTQDDKPVRLFRKGKARFVQPVHEKVEVDGPIGLLKASMNHYTYPDARGYVERFNLYTSLEAKELAARKAPCGFRELVLKPLALFFKLYVLKQGFRDGGEGLAFSWLSACYAFTKHAKQWERERGHVR